MVADAGLRASRWGAAAAAAPGPSAVPADGPGPALKAGYAACGASAAYARPSPVGVEPGHRGRTEGGHARRPHLSQCAVPGVVRRRSWPALLPFWIDRVVSGSGDVLP